MFRIFRKAVSDQSDEELLSLYRSGGDMEVLGRLYERYVELVYGVCLKYFKNETEAEDAVMAIFEEIIEKCKTQEVRQFRPWLYVTARNHCLMALRKAGRNFTVSSDPALMQSGEFWHPDTGEADEQTLPALGKCMEQLPPQQKLCIDLFYLQGKSYKDIAAAQGEEVGKVRSNIQNGRRNLKMCLEKAGVAPE